MGLSMPESLTHTSEQILSITEYLSAAALDAAGAELLRVEAGAAGGRCTFIFDDRDGRASALLHQHRSGVLRVNSRDYAAAVHRAKDQLFAARR